METLIGIDEAGYGPTLGPLVIAASVLEGAQTDPSLLFSALSAGVASEPGDLHRLRIADSKLVYRGGKGLKDLEETVLACAFEAGLPHEVTLETLLLALGQPPGPVAEAPWYQPSALSLPVRAFRTSIERKGERFREALGAAGLTLRNLHARIVPPGAFNSGLKRARNKLDMHASLVGGLIRDLARGSRERVRIECDRLGGRSSYGPLLGGLFPGARFKILEQGERSAYHIRAAAAGRAGSEPALPAPQEIWVAFTVEADRTFLPVALASMAAKYLRELFMHQFNAWWNARVPGIRETAGYPVDARRWLADAEPMRRALDLPDEILIRER